MASENRADTPDGVYRREVERDDMVKADVIMVGDPMIDTTILCRPGAPTPEQTGLLRQVGVGHRCEPGGVLLVQQFFGQLTDRLPCVLGVSPTYSHKIRYVSEEGELLFRFDEDATGKNESRSARSKGAFTAALRQERGGREDRPGLVLVDYGKSFISPSRPALSLGQWPPAWAVIESKKPEVVLGTLGNLRGDCFSVVKMNLHEAVERFGGVQTGGRADNDPALHADIVRAVDRCLGVGAASVNRMVVVTLGAAGAVALLRLPGRGGTVLRCPAVRNDGMRSIDFVGAGDAVTAAIAARCFKDFGGEGTFESLARNCLTDGVAAGTLRVSRGRGAVVAGTVSLASASLSNLVIAEPL